MSEPALPVIVGIIILVGGLIAIAPLGCWIALSGLRATTEKMLAELRTLNSMTRAKGYGDTRDEVPLGQMPERSRRR